MFTGIVEEVGRLVSRTPADNGVLLTVEAPIVAAGLRPGASIAVQGVCQTVLTSDATTFQIAAEAETLRLTTLGRLQVGAAVNLERALAVDGRFDGHLVQGHVDGTARVVSVRTEGRSTVLEVEIGPELLPFVIPKGSIAIDGVSLTVGPRTDGGRFELFLIPYTREHTSLGRLASDTLVNVETDVVGRYVAHWLGRSGDPASRDFDRDTMQRALGGRSQ